MKPRAGEKKKIKKGWTLDLKWEGNIFKNALLFLSRLAGICVFLALTMSDSVALVITYLDTEKKEA